MPEATTTSGPITGRQRGDALMEFRGVPYAAPPVGDLRWRAPEPHASWSYFRECKQYWPSAWQRGGDKRFLTSVISRLGLGRAKTRLLIAAVRWAPLKESEDCLTLNVTAPPDADGLPIMVWFHGGDHTDGSGNSPAYRSRILPMLGCVLITVNYRLGLFGFLAHPELADETQEHTSGNYGLLDQIAALRWIRDNGAAFGGDPDRVTIFGESAGGQAVLNLMASPPAKGLFDRAIAQSPGDSARWLRLRAPSTRFDAAESIGAEFASAAVGAGDGQLTRLRSMDAGDLMQLYRDRIDLGRHFFPAIGGTALPRSPYAAFRDGAQAPVPLICGYNKDEGSAFADYLDPSGGEMGERGDDADGIRAALLSTHESPARVEELLVGYPGLAEGELDAARAHLTDHMFAAHVEYVTRKHGEHGHLTYRYRFDAEPASDKQTIGAFHSSEIAPIFGTALPFIDSGEGHNDLAREMSSRWVQFASDAPLVGESGLQWPVFGESSRVLRFDRAVGDTPPSAVHTEAPSTGISVLTGRIERLIEASRDQ